ncbi:hypothetical protein ABIE89_008532 [Bradyrhizobium niftali]
MHQPDKEAVVGQDMDSRPVRADDEAGVLADRYLGKRMRTPVRFSIAQRRAADPGPRGAGIDIFPCPARARLDEQDAVDAADIGLVALKRLDLGADARRRVPVVVVPVQNDVTARLGASGIAFGAERPVAAGTEIADLRMRGYQFGKAIVAVIEDDEFLVGKVLPEKHADRLRHELPPVRGGHDAGNARQGGLLGQIVRISDVSISGRELSD